VTGAARQVAVVDTSFWSIAVRIGLVRLLLAEFALAVPAAVREEILHEDPRRPRTRSDYQDVFLEIEPELVALPNPEPHPIAGLDVGEASVIACAQALGVIALINERRGKRVAAALGVVAIDVAQVVVLLVADGRLTVPAGRGLLARIRKFSSTPREQLTEAESVLDAIEQQAH
jgi:predicted nucleic acid-binding protein